MAKVTFDGQNKIIDIDSPNTSIDVKIDLYSDWKEWVKLGDNSKWEQAFAVVGGEPLPGGKYVPSFYFLINGWKVRTYLGTTTIFIGTNLFTEDGSTPFISGGTRASVIAETTTGVTVESTDASAIIADLNIINEGVQKASKLIPHNTDL